MKINGNKENRKKPRQNPKCHSPMLILSPLAELTHIQSKFVYAAEHEPELPFSDDLPRKEV